MFSVGVALPEETILTSEWNQNGRWKPTAEAIKIEINSQRIIDMSVEQNIEKQMKKLLKLIPGDRFLRQRFY